MELGFWDVYGAVLLAQITGFIIFEAVHYVSALFLAKKREQRVQEYMEALRKQGIDPYNLQGVSQFSDLGFLQNVKDQNFPVASGESSQDQGHGHYL